MRPLSSAPCINLSRFSCRLPRMALAQVFSGKWQRTPVAVKKFKVENYGGVLLTEKTMNSLKQVCLSACRLAGRAGRAGGAGRAGIQTVRSGVLDRGASPPVLCLACSWRPGVPASLGGRASG